MKKLFKYVDLAMAVLAGIALLTIFMPAIENVRSLMTGKNITGLDILIAKSEPFSNVLGFAMSIPCCNLLTYLFIIGGLVCSVLSHLKKGKIFNYVAIGCSFMGAICLLLTTVFYGIAITKAQFNVMNDRILPLGLGVGSITGAVCCMLAALLGAIRLVIELSKKIDFKKYFKYVDLAVAVMGVLSFLTIILPTLTMDGGRIWRGFMTILGDKNGTRFSFMNAVTYLLVIGAIACGVLSYQKEDRIYSKAAIICSAVASLFFLLTKVFLSVENEQMKNYIHLGAFAVIASLLMLFAAVISWLRYYLDKPEEEAAPVEESVGEEPKAE